MWANKCLKVETRSRESNSGPYDCEANALPHTHGQHTCALNPLFRAWFNNKYDLYDFVNCCLYILNQKRNFRKIGLRGGHTRYERKKKSTPTSNKTEISNEINDFQTVHEL